VGTYPGASSVELGKAIIRTQMDQRVSSFRSAPTILISALAAGQIDAFFAPSLWDDRHLSRNRKAPVEEPLGLLRLKRICWGRVWLFVAVIKGEPWLAKRTKAIYYKAVDLIDKDRTAYRPLLINT